MTVQKGGWDYFEEGDAGFGFVAGQSHNRERPSVTGTVEKVSWSNAENIRGLLISVMK